MSAAAVGAVGTPVNAGDASGAFVPTRVVRFVIVSGESPSASANSLRVFRSAGAPSTRFDTAVPIAELRFVTSVDIADVSADAAVASAAAWAAAAAP